MQKAALISGAGVAGPAVAYWLNAAGWQTTIIERAPAPRTGGYVIDFWGLGYDLAERMGLLGEIETVGYHVRDVRVVGDHGQPLAGFGTRVFDELTDGRFVTLARSDLSRLILDAVRPATEVIFGDEIVELNQDDHGVDAVFANSERRFDLVVGADGLHSRVRRIAFGPDAAFEKPLGYAVAAFEADGYRARDPDAYLMYCEPGRMVGRFTLRGDRTLFLFIFAIESDLPAELAEQKQLVDTVYRGGRWETDQILEHMKDAGDFYLDRVSQIKTPTWSHDRIALTGDAAFCVSLLAGQGSALAIVGAYVLAGELTRARGRLREGLIEYERRLRPYVALKQAGAARFARAFAPRSRFGMRFRNLVLQSLALPGIAKFAVGREIIDRLDLPEYRWEEAVA